ncbi:hypothetical protein DAPPUDRAFT_120228 [Daphnia pulex]|uniref:Uncharacterized protein n=1 Tax=Daphnia pulex TaxID=6669 RepID=E9I0M9_DAPPU|nr:hypothetical protein DAPPUDRAFT_120228 [Daphnia pulex]|eukprot:EFX62452.1 hypothetical protein DAPPUDRAFT_120228 [Daphnia pulex]
MLASDKKKFIRKCRVEEGNPSFVGVNRGDCSIPLNCYKISKGSIYSAKTDSTAFRCATNYKEGVCSLKSAATIIKLRIQHIKNSVDTTPLKKPKIYEIKMLRRLLFVIRNVIAKTIVLEKEAIRDLAANVKDIDDDVSAVGLLNKQLYWVLVDEHFFERIEICYKLQRKCCSFQSAVNVIQLRVEHIKNDVEEKPAKKPKNRHDSLQERSWRAS